MITLKIDDYERFDVFRKFESCCCFLYVKYACKRIIRKENKTILREEVEITEREYESITMLERLNELDQSLATKDYVLKHIFPRFKKPEPYWELGDEEGYEISIS